MLVMWGDWFEPRCRWWRVVIQQVQSGSIDQFLSYPEFINVSETPDSFAPTTEKIIHPTSGVDRFDILENERIVYRSTWPVYWDLLCTCIICLAKVRNVALQNLISESNPSDSLKALQAAIQPDLESSQLPKRRWDMFKDRFERNWPRSGSEADTETNQDKTRHILRKRLSITIAYHHLR
jgi:hypothetical protein